MHDAHITSLHRVWIPTENAPAYILPHAVPVYCIAIQSYLYPEIDESAENTSTPFLTVISGARDGVVRMWHVLSHRTNGRVCFPDSLLFSRTSSADR